MFFCTVLLILVFVSALAGDVAALNTVLRSCLWNFIPSYWTPTLYNLTVLGGIKWIPWSYQRVLTKYFQIMTGTHILYLNGPHVICWPKCWGVACCVVMPLKIRTRHKWIMAVVSYLQAWLGKGKGLKIPRLPAKWASGDHLGAIQEATQSCLIWTKNAPTVLIG